MRGALYLSWAVLNLSRQALGLLKHKQALCMARQALDLYHRSQIPSKWALDKLKRLLNLHKRLHWPLNMLHKLDLLHRALDLPCLLLQLLQWALDLPRRRQARATWFCPTSSWVRAMNRPVRDATFNAL